MAHCHSFVAQVRPYVFLAWRLLSFQGPVCLNFTCKSRGLIPSSRRLLRQVPTMAGFCAAAKAVGCLLQASLLECRKKIGPLKYKAFFARHHSEHKCGVDFASAHLHAIYMASTSSHCNAFAQIKELVFMMAWYKEPP